MSGESRRLVAQTCKSVCVSALIVLAAVLVFALFIRLFSISSAVIMPVNQVIKLLSVAAGCILCLREKPVLCGAAAGAATAVVTYFLFAVIAGSISFGWLNVLDVVCGAAAGGLSALIAAAAKNRG